MSGRCVCRDAARRKKELEDRVKTNQEALAAKIIRDMDYERKEEERKAIDKVGRDADMTDCVEGEGLYGCEGGGGALM